MHYHALILGTLLSVNLLSCVPRNTFVLAEGTGHGWVVVEQRERCEAGDGDGRALTFRVPPSRYLCTSSQVADEFAHWQYRIVREGRQQELRIDDLIHRPMHIESGAIDGVHYPCRYEGFAFFYGPVSAVARDPVDVIREHRPECRGPGGVAAKRPKTRSRIQR